MNVSSATDPFLTANTAASGTDSSSSTLASDFSALSTAIQSGNSSDAQTALAKLEEDSPTLAKAIENASPNSALGSLATAVQNGNMTDAQKALATLQEAMKAHRQGGDDDDSASDPDGSDASSAPVAPEGTGSIINVSA